MGLERITMLLYQIDDIRTLYENDVRFLNHEGLEEVVVSAPIFVITTSRA